MKKSKLYIIGLLGLAFAFSGCESENLGFDEGEATLVIEPEISTEITTSPISRAAEDAVDQENLMHKLNVVVSTPKGNAICYWNSSTGFPWKDDTESAMEYKLNSGSYIVEGWTGDSIAASWTRRYFKGKQSVTLKPGTRTSVRLTCKIVNTAVEVKYSDQIDDVLSHYTLVVTTASTSLNFEGREERTGYFMLPTKSHDMDWVFNGIRKDGTNIHMHGTIKDAKASTKYSFRIKYEDPGVQYGGSAIKIDVDESTMDVEHEVQFRTRPEVKRCSEEGLFDIGEEMPYPATAEKVGDIELMARSSGRITSVDIEMQGIESVLPDMAGRINLYGGANAQANRDKLLSSGIECGYEEDPSNGISSFPIVFHSTLTNRLPEGNYKFTLSVADEAYAAAGSDAKNISKTFVLVVTSDKAIAVKPSDDETISLFESQIRLVGQVTEDGVNEVGFYYRAAGSDTPWENARYVSGTASLPSRSFTNGSRFYATVSGLTTDRTYEYVAAFDRKPAISSVVEVSTGSAPQLPNAGFESWDTSSKAYLICSPGSEMFWDSGNHGSATMNKNVTIPATDVKHSGSRSIKLESQFVGFMSIGKFAAGNLFIGKYLKTDGTDGVLGWGRPWTARPRQLRGYIKYTPGTVEYTNSGAPDIVKGELDKGIIYIAMLSDDTSTQGDSGYKEYPVVVKTKGAHLFDKNASNVIAYGELVLESATEGSGMVEFTIDLDYNRMDIRPSYIMLTASASKGGDYFAGGNSVMYLDDLELVY